MANVSTLEWQGNTYTLAPWGDGIRGRFESFMEKRAWEAAGRGRPHLGPEEWRELLADVGRDIAVGKYTFGTKLVEDACKSIPCLTYLIFLMIEENHHEIKLMQVQEMVREDIDAIIAKMNQANADTAESPVPIEGAPVGASSTPT